MATEEQIARAGEFRRMRVPMDKWMTCAQVDELMADFAESEAQMLLAELEGIAETLDKMAPCPEEILDQLLKRAQAVIQKARG